MVCPAVAADTCEEKLVGVADRSHVAAAAAGERSAIRAATVTTPARAARHDAGETGRHSVP
jgi:hypothetical protein